MEREIIGVSLSQGKRNEEIRGITKMKNVRETVAEFKRGFAGHSQM